MKSVEIKIDRPCSEKWESFEKRGINGFCGSCQKEVVDFTKMSNTEIKDYFLNTKGEVCGRMRKNQQGTFTFERTSKTQKFLSSLVAAGAMLMTSIPAISQEKDKIEVVQLAEEDRINVSPKVVSGVVTDDSGETLPGVNVVIKGTTIGTNTDLDGNYRITIKRGSSLVFSFVGFETQEVEIGSRSVIDISMGGATELGEVMLGGVSSRWYTPRGLWWRVRGFFRRIF